MKKIATSIIVVFIALACTTGESKYKLLRSNNIDVSQWKNYLGAKRTQYDIEVSANTGDKEIKIILKQAVKDLSKKRKVDGLSVQLYLKNTNLPYAIAEWAPEGKWGKVERGKLKSIFKTSIQIYPERRPKKSSNVKKFSLSLAKRKIIYREISQSQKRTRQIAYHKYPDDFMKEFDHMTELDKKYEKKICYKYNITDKQKSSIIAEGALNNWPLKK